MAVRLLKIAAFYFILGVCLGLFMSINHSYQYTGVHTHLNLLGWVSFALAGLIYLHFPKAEQHVLGKLHFWGHNIGLPAMMIGLFLLAQGISGVEPVIAIGGLLTTLSILLFFINIVMNVQEKNG